MLSYGAWQITYPPSSEYLCPNARMSDARPLPSQTTTGTGGVSRRYSKTIEITLGPPSTMSATTGTPWPIPALKKEKKRKKEKRTQSQQTKETKKRNKKHKLKLLSTGGGNNILVGGDKNTEGKLTESPLAECSHQKVYLTLPFHNN